MKTSPVIPIKRNSTQNKTKKNNETKNYSISDTICQIILEKIISNVFQQSLNNTINSKINDYCFNFLSNCINSFIKTDFIFYENEQYNNDKDKEKLYYSSTTPRATVNKKIEIMEPKMPDYDRYDSVKAKIVKENKSNNSNSEISITNNISSNYQEQSSEKKLFCKYVVKRSQNKLNTLKEALEFDAQGNNNKNADNKNNKKEKKSHDENENNKNKNKNKINLKEKDIINKIGEITIEKSKAKRKSQYIVIDLPYSDLPRDVYENKYIQMNSNEENNLLRIEKEKEIFDKEQKKLLEENRNKLENENNLKINQNKEFDYSKVTFDPNGEIINVNIPSTDTFSKEFFISKTSIIEKNRNINITGKRISSPNVKLNNLDSTNENNDKNNNDNIVNQNGENENNQIEELKKRLKNLKKRFSLIPKSKSNIKSLINAKKIEKIEYNPISIEEKKVNQALFHKSKVLPSGHNFDKIIPEVGVIIKNDDNQSQVKEGGFEFYNKYNKPSVNEYSTLMMETLKINQQLLTSSLSSGNLNKNNSRNIYNTETQEYNGYKQEFNDNNNPLIQNAFQTLSVKKQLKLNDINNINITKTLIKNKSSIIPNTYNTNNKKMLFNTIDGKHYKIKNTELSNNIKIKKNLVPNLYSFLTVSDKSDKDENNDILFKGIKIGKLKIVNGSSDAIIKSNNNNKYHSVVPLPKKKFNIKEKNILPKIKINNNSMSQNKENNLELIGEDFMDDFNSKIIKNKNWGIFSGKDTHEVKNIFRKPIKYYKLNELKQSIEPRKRAPHNINTHAGKK